MVAVELADVQGFILRGYTMPVSRYFGLSVRESTGTRAFLTTLVGNDPTVPSITTAQPWAMKPEYCVNLGITFRGLAALEVPQASLASFPVEYREGAVARAATVGDVGTSAPDQWLPWLADPGLHLLLLLSAQSSAALDSATKPPQQASSPSVAALGRHDAPSCAGHAPRFAWPG